MQVGDAPVFIVGVGRSGTSLVHSMLAAHSRLAFPPEINFLRRFLATNRIGRAFGQGGCKRVIELLEADPYLGRLGLDLHSVLARLKGGRLDDRIVYKTLLKAYAAQQGKARFGDKDPRSIEYLTLIWRHFPDAFIVHIIRDPRDVLASKKKAAWSRGRSPFLHIAANRVQMRIGRRLGPRLFGSRYLEVFYERLLANPEKTARRLLMELGLDDEPVVARFSEAARLLVSKEELPWKKETLGKLMRGNSGKWRRELSETEILLCEALCHEAMQAGGYEASAIRPAPHKRLLIYSLKLPICLAAAVYPVYRSLLIRRNLRGARTALATSSEK